MQNESIFSSQYNFYDGYSNQCGLTDNESLNFEYNNFDVLTDLNSTQNYNFSFNRK